MLDLETERLYFSMWGLKDIPIFTQFFSAEEQARYVGGIKSPKEAWRLMASYMGHYSLLGYSYLAVHEKSSDSLIGTVGLWNSTPWPEPELGYWLLPKGQGKGYGLEAGLAVKDFALKTAKLSSLVSYIDPANMPSKRLAQKIGAKLDGIIELLDFGRHEVYRYF